MSRMKLGKSFIVLGLFGLAFFSFNNAIAANTADIAVEVEPFLNLSISNDEISIDDIQIGTLNTSSAVNINVSTNNQTGYTLSMVAGSSANDSSDLVNPAEPTFYFSALSTSESYTSSDFPSNSWGYSIDAGVSFHGINKYSSGATELKITSVSSSDAIPFSISAQVGEDMISGIYQNIITFTAVANYVPPAYFMQDIDLDMKDAIENGEITTLYDERDYKQYYVAKIGDDIWMTQNLDYVPSGATWEDDGIYAGDGTIYTDGTATTAGGTDKHFSQGSYYNWNTAKTVCPSGWELPSKTQLEAVSNGKNQVTILASPFYGVRAGYVNSGKLGSVGSYGYYWSPAEFSVDSAYLMIFGRDNVRMSSSSKLGGVSVRCVAKKYMQEINNDIRDAISNGKITTLTDSRDGKDYYVSKIGNDIWMTQNLDYAPTGSTWEDDGIYAGGGNIYTDGTATTTGGTDKHFSQGSYYNWSTANTVCPTGWALPTKSQLEAVISGKTEITILKSPFYGTSVGFFSSSGLDNAGVIGYYWSSTESTENNAHFLYFGDGDIILDYYSKTSGYSVRCVVNAVENITQISTMQQFGNLSDPEKVAVLSNMTTGSSYTLTDSRDGESYSIAKLADGRIWMLDNLRLGGASAITLTSSDTNITSNWTLPASGSWISSSQDSNTTAYINSSYANTTATSYGSGSGKIGVFYNFCAASAGTICVETNSNDASYDICPKGWKLPTGGSSGEFQVLYTAYGSSNSSFRSALSVPYSGRFSSGSASGQNEYGYLWSSTRNNDSKMHRLNIGPSYTTTSYGGVRYGGSPLRCIGK